MLTAGELSSMRSTAGAALPDTAVIQTQAWVSDGGGGGSTAWTSSGTVNCRLAPATGQGAMEDETGERITPEAEFVCTFDSTVAIDTDSRVITSGGTFNVEAVRTRSWNLSTRAELRRET